MRHVSDRFLSRALGPLLTVTFSLLTLRASAESEAQSAQSSAKAAAPADESPPPPLTGASTLAKPEPNTEKPEPARTALGARAFMGVGFRDGESSPLFGGGALLGFPIFRAFEGEYSVLLVGLERNDPFFVSELIAKWVPEWEGELSPHLGLGPLISVDFTSPAEVSGGILASGGLTWWASERLGWTTDLTYRHFFGEEPTDAVALALGVSVRPFSRHLTKRR